MDPGPDDRPGLPYVHVADVVVRHPATGELALVHRSDGSWWLPGGRVENGESFVQAAQREVAEETGLDVAIEGIIGVTEQIGDQGHVVFFTCRGRWLSGDPAPPGNDPKIVRAEWVSEHEARRLLPEFSITPLIFDTPEPVPHYVEEPS